MQQSLFHRRLCRIGIIAFLSLSAWADSPYELKNGAGVTSRYTPVLVKMLNEWSKRPAIEPLVAYRTPDADFYIGIGHQVVIDAPLEKAKVMLDDMDNFIHYYPGYKKIRVTKREPAFWESEWEQIIPVFFVPNIDFKLIHWTDAKPDRIVTRYQMKESEDLKSCDGIIVLERKGDHTHYEEYMFADTDLGILKTLAPNQIWLDTIRDLHLAAIGLKLRTENPDWDFPKIRTSARAMLTDAEVRQAFDSKMPLSVTIN